MHAALLTALSYAVLTFYDKLAMKDIGVELSYRKTAFASFVGYVFSHNIGLSVLGGGASRYRVYSAFGLSAIEIFKVVAFCAATFWLGMIFITGAVLIREPGDVAAGLHLPIPVVRSLGAVLVLSMVGYVVWCRFRRAPISFRGWSFTLPTTGIAVTQIVLSSIDWLVAASVLFSLLPDDVQGSHGYVRIVGVYLFSIVIAAASHSPGGIGVLEVSVAHFLGTDENRVALLGSLLAFRAIYYILPLVLGAVMLGLYELGQRLATLRKLTGVVEKWGPAIVPRTLAASTFCAGAVLLFSGATPPLVERIDWLQRAIPLPVLEASHFLGSLIGVALLMLAHGLQRRIDFAWIATSALLAAGIVFSMLKGLDWEPALILAVILAALLPCRREFTRKASILTERFTLGWLAALVVVLASASWLVFFSFKHYEYGQETWWRFEFVQPAPRSLRAMVGAAVVLAGFGLTRLLRPKPPAPQLPDESTLARAVPIVRASRDTLASLALLGDKTLLFSPSGRSFLMYAVQGRSWVALGDPVGEEEEGSSLVWSFRELVYRHGGWTVFYGVHGDRLPLYLELGCTLLKLGEEARVKLADFTLDGGEGRNLRKTVHKLLDEGCSFELAPPLAVPELLPELERVSNDWLAAKATREKGFSLGFFAPDYLRRFPIALVKRSGRVVAFANVWAGDVKDEFSVDLMRFASDAPQNAMDFLFAQLMSWGRDQGFAFFNLGMAPLSGLDPRPLAPLWSKIGAALFQHGEPFYNFQGIRQYKEKFHPEWRPRYLATPGGLSLPGVLTNVATLISGGVRGLFKK